MQMFILGYQFRNRPILIDDVDGLLHNDETISILKMLCETREIKEVAWHTTSSLLEKSNVPASYETKSKVCVLTNNFRELTKKVSALKDRGWHIIFSPTDEEILDKIKEIIPCINEELSFEEKIEVFYLIKEYSKFCEFSLRTFVKGLDLYKECRGKEISWKKILLNEMRINPKLVLLNELLEKYSQEKERIDEWEMKGYSKRSYYDYKNLLMHKCSHI